MLHGATGYHQVSPVADLHDDYRLGHVFSHPFEQMTALADLISTGAIGRGPRVTVVEAGSGWLPWFLDRLQGHFDHTGGCDKVDIDVRATLHERLLLSVEPADPWLGAVIDAGLGHILAYGSDYPHWDAASPEDLKLLEQYGEGMARRVLYQNAHEFFFGGAHP